MHACCMSADGATLAKMDWRLMACQGPQIQLAPRNEDNLSAAAHFFCSLLKIVCMAITATSRSKTSAFV